MQKPISKKLISLSLIIVVFSGLFLVNVGGAEAAPGILADIAKEIGQGMASIALHIAHAFTAFVGNIFKGIVDFGFQQMDTVRMGWTITRDIVNMFFILGLIVIAFATILRIETYGIKALLPKLIIIALLINFSYLVCGLIIDATQIAATYFLNQIQTDDIAIAILSRLQVIDAMRGTEGMRIAITDYDPDMVVILTTAFSAIVIFLAGFVMLVGAILLFIRVGALWALIILAPFAWFFSIFPGKLKSYSGQWWNSFLQYAFFAPIYIFFIFLVLKISEGTVLKDMGLATGETAVGLANFTLVPMFGDLNLLFRYVFLIILLFGAPTIAMSMGIKGAGAAQSFVKGGLKGTAKLAYKLPGKLRGAMVAPPGLLKAIAPKTMRRLSTVAKWTTPAFWKQAIEERKKERLREAKVGYTIAKQQDLMNYVLSIGQKKTRHAEEVEQFEVNEEAEKMALETGRDSGRLVEALKNAVAGKDTKRAKATLKLLFDQKDHNDMQMAFGDWKWTDHKDNKEKKGKKYGPTTDNIALKDLVFQMFEKMGVSEQKAAPFITDLNQVAFKSGVYGAYHFTKTDDKGRNVRANDQEQLQVTATKLGTQSMRKTGREGHATMWIKQGWDKTKNKYTFEGWDRVGLENIKNMSPGQIKQVRYNEMNQVRLELASDGMLNAEKHKREKNIKTIEEEIMAVEEWSAEEKQIALRNAKELKEKIKDYATGTAEEGTGEGAKKEAWKTVGEEIKKSEEK